VADSSAKFGTTFTPRQALRVRPAWAGVAVLLLVLSLPLAWWQAPFPRPEQRFGERSLLEMLWYPLEVNGLVRVPLAPARMNALASAEDHEWAVGGGGTILATADGGTSWAAQTSGTQTFLSAVQFQPDGQRGWAVGASGTILATADGGTSWAAQTSGTQAQLLPCSSSRMASAAGRSL
jgi:hypothetical protein